MILQERVYLQKTLLKDLNKAGYFLGVSLYCQPKAMLREMPQNLYLHQLWSSKNRFPFKKSPLVKMVPFFEGGELWKLRDETPRYNLVLPSLWRLSTICAAVMALVKAWWPGKAQGKQDSQNGPNKNDLLVKNIIIIWYGVYKNIYIYKYHIAQCI